MAFWCPRCGREIQERDGRLRCENCQVSWPIVNAVPHFVESAPYWGEAGLTQAIARELLREMRSRSWHEVMRAHPSEDVRMRYRITSDPGRAGWSELLDIGAESIVLDVGAGLGGISQALSRRYAQVYAIERVEERVQFMKLRFEQEQCQNITVVRADADTLPFPERYFDLIVLNGVLEWLPFSRKQDNPRDAQLHYIRRLRNLLKPGGVLAVGIENRTDYGLLLGSEDPHISIRYVAVLPRIVADLICRLKIGDRYRPYLYSHAGYRKLIREAGYKSVEIYGAWPGYANPKKLLSLKKSSIEFVDHVWVTKNPLSRWIKKIMVRLDLLKYFGPAYVLFARA